MSFTYVKYVLKDLLKLLFLSFISLYIQENSLLHVEYVRKDQNSFATK